MATRLKLLKETKSLWHQSYLTSMLGCTTCRLAHVCGGLSVSAPHFSCHQMCTCAPDARCNFVCPSRVQSYVRYVREVGGFELHSIPRSDPVPISDLPQFVPMLYGRACRTTPLKARCVAVPLAALFSRRTGLMKYPSREALASAFLIDESCRLIISGVDVDQSLERYWQLARAANIVAGLAVLKPDLVTVPNFSLFVNAPREDNLHNMKRIALCWHEMASAGLPSALHVNARTDRDWERWAEFLACRPEIGAISFEFATGSRFPARGSWHADQLCRLSQRVGRELQLVLRGSRYIDSLRGSYQRVTLIDTSVYVKSMRRQMLVRTDQGACRWERGWSLIGEPLDRIVDSNLEASAHAYASRKQQ